MAYDYNLPFGPWGQELTPEQLTEHASLCEKFEFLCASQHLADYVGKWGEGSYRAQCCYAADYGYFDPLPTQFNMCESKHSFVTFVSPCPEKGLCIFLRLAELMPQTQFLVVKTEWTKLWHEQPLKKLQNVKIQTGTQTIDEFLSITRVLIVPSVSQEAFSLITLEAQLRGVPVVSTDVCGLVEANRVPATVVPNISAVYDQRTRELILGMTMVEAECTLAHDREGALSMPAWRQTAVNQENFQKLASEEDVESFATMLRSVMERGENEVQKASQEVRLAASSFVEARNGQLLTMLQQALEEHAAAGDAKPAPALKTTSTTASTQTKSRKGDDLDKRAFDVNQDFTKVENFDGRALSAQCLVRLCEQGGLSLAAELLQAKADVNCAENEIGITPLIAAANAGHLDICKYLLRKQADVDIPVGDGTSRTALHAASNMGFSSIVQLLLEKKAGPKTTDISQYTPLHLAVRNGHLGATELLLKHKANPNQSDDQGQVPINDAVAKDRFDLVSKLLEHGSLVNVRNMAGLEAISFSRTPQMQSIIMKRDVNF